MTSFFLILSKFEDTFITFLCENYILMGFPVLKAGEVFRTILTTTKKLYLHKAYFFDLLNTFIAKMHILFHASTAFKEVISLSRIFRHQHLNTFKKRKEKGEREGTGRQLGC